MAPACTTNLAWSFYYHGKNRLVVLDGLLAGTNRWVALTNGPVVAAGSWARACVRLDDDTQT